MVLRILCRDIDKQALGHTVILQCLGGVTVKFRFLSLLIRLIGGEELLCRIGRIGSAELGTCGQGDNGDEATGGGKTKG